MPDRTVPGRTVLGRAVLGRAVLGRAVLGRSLLVICGSTAVLIAAMLPAEAATTGWRTAAIVVVNDEAMLDSVHAVSATDAWAAGASVYLSGNTEAPLVEHWAGKSWRRVKLPATVAARWTKVSSSSLLVGASASTNVWAFSEAPAGSTAYDAYLRLNGKAWTAGKLPGTDYPAHYVQINATEVLSKSEVWVFGGKFTTNGSDGLPYAAEFNGRKWLVKPVPGTGEITAASAISSRNIWAVTAPSTAPGTGKVLHWNGTRWRDAASQPSKLPAGASLTAIETTPANDVWIAGAAPKRGGGTAAQFVDKWSGTSWAQAPTDLTHSASSVPCQSASVVPDGHGGLWALGLCYANTASSLWHFTKGRWASVSVPKFGGTRSVLVQLARVPGTGSVWAAGGVTRGTSADGLIAIDGPTPR